MAVTHQRRVTPQVEPEPRSLRIFLARQPIFDRHQTVTGYELLYRSATGGNAYDATDGNHATAHVIVNGVMGIGLERITGGARAFINFPGEMLTGGHWGLLPKQHTVIEVLEGVEPEPAVVAACAKLRNEGYTLAVDDYVLGHERFAPLVDLADILKVDFRLADADHLSGLAGSLRRRRTKLLAEKVETEEQFRNAVAWGYRFFQGFFFARPVVLGHAEVPGFKLNYLRMLQEVNRPELDFDQLELLVKADLSLSYRLLRYINSPIFGWRQRVDSIRQALVRLGEHEFRKWVSLMCLTVMAEDRPRELLVQCAVRAHFCEELAAALNLTDRRSDLFLTGLFSLLDSFAARPLEELLVGLPVADDVKAALLRREGLLGEVLNTVVAYEQGDWAQLGQAIGRLGLHEELVPRPYFRALQRAQAVFGS